MIYLVNKRTKEHQAVPDGFPVNGYPINVWRFIEADADGWIEWHGGECPLPDGHPVELRFRTGDTTRSRVSGPWKWSHDGSALPIIAYRPILDADTGPTIDVTRLVTSAEPPAWSGEGLPPVGCECEVKVTRGYRSSRWVAVTIYGYYGALVWFKENDHGSFAGEIGGVQFRPIRSEEDRETEDIARIIAYEFDATLGDCLLAARALRKAGYRK